MIKYAKPVQSKFWLIVISFTFFASCSKRSLQELYEGAPTKIENIGACNPTPCLKLQLADFPSLTGVVPNAARKTIEDELVAELYESPLEDRRGVSKEELVAELRSFFEDEVNNALKKESSGSSSVGPNFEVSRSIKLTFINSKVASFVVQKSGFLGGAHGLDTTTLLTFAVDSGKRLSLQDLLTDHSESVFSAVAEMEFRRVRNIPVGQSLEEAGFSLPEAKGFKLGNNFAVSEAGIVLHYNAYEAASYAFGPTTVQIPKDGVLPLLKDAYIFDPSVS